MGPKAQKPLQPVSTTFISLTKPLLSSSCNKAFFTAWLPED
jgi:hypothetical protein